MTKYYRVNEDDFETLPFYSEMDEGWEGHALIVEEQFKEEFIAEQVARFTRHLLSIIHKMPTREEQNPFCRISSKYPRFHSNLFGTSIECPCCKAQIGEDEWNETFEDLDACCPICEYKFEMEGE